MPRQTISLSEPNSKWLQQRGESGEFSTQTEAVNDALRRIREIEAQSGLEALRAHITHAKNSGISSRRPQDILKASKDELRRNGDL